MLAFVVIVLGNGILYGLHFTADNMLNKTASTKLVVEAKLQNTLLGQILHVI